MRFLILVLIVFAHSNTFAVKQFPVEHFFQDPQMLNPQLSPDGDYLAALLPFNINEETQKVCKQRTKKLIETFKKQGYGDVSNNPELLKQLKKRFIQPDKGVHLCDRSRRNIVVIWLSDPNPDCQQGNFGRCERVRVTQLRSQNVSGFFWANNERIIFETGGDQLNGISGYADTLGLYAVNKDGSKDKQLVKPADADGNVVPLNLLKDDPDHILVMRNDRKRYLYDIYKMNVFTGNFFREISPPGPVVSWGADHEGVVRLAAMQDENSLSYETQIIYRENEDSEWREVDRFEGLQNGWGSLGFTEDNKKIYITSNLGRDTYSIGLFDPETGDIKDLFENEGTDVTRLGFSDDGEAITIVYNDINTKPKRHFINEKWKNII